MKKLCLFTAIFTVFLFGQFTAGLYADEKTVPIRVGIYIFEGAEVVDFTAPYGVFAVARRLDPSIEVFLIADTM
ncbi:MAG TPA: hypothetical protein ACFYEG_08220, partial [Candidatus Wujingus californicus]